jgi:hypothetical protein
MSDEDNSLKALGKRSRDESDAADIPEMPPADMDDSSDDEIGPMPTPGGDGDAGNGKKRKKKRRAGELSTEAETMLQDTSGLGRSRRGSWMCAGKDTAPRSTGGR